MMVRVRDLSLNLRPTMLDDLGLLPALVWHFERLQAQRQIAVHFEQTGLSECRFPPAVETAAYRIVQEALTNAARHAGVTTVAVRFWANDAGVHFEVEDHGRGFDPNTVGAGRTCGLAGIRERVRLLGGEFQLESAPGAGTFLSVFLPVPVGKGANGQPPHD
jgi:signal transduction histidine kinase